jgi:hypothetical protein
MIIAAHQPNFLPYTGFWWKLANSDFMDLRYRAQYTDRGYQRRVMMRDKWCSIPVLKQQYYEPIDKVRIDLPKAKVEARNTILGRYRNAPHWKQHGPDLIDVMNSIESEYLWEWNLRLLLHVRDVLGIQTPFVLGSDTIGDKAAGVVSLMRCYPQDGNLTYLSGTGARAYMEDTTVFTEAGIKVEWSRHKALTNDSILTVLMDYQDPMEIVMMEHAEGQGEA